jgi:hypothetical protein
VQISVLLPTMSQWLTCTYGWESQTLEELAKRELEATSPNICANDQSRAGSHCLGQELLAKKYCNGQPKATQDSCRFKGALKLENAFVRDCTPYVHSQPHSG